MIKAQVIEEFTLEKFDELKNIIRKNPSRSTHGYLYIGDIFECTKEIADYLMGGNSKAKTVISIIEVIPEAKKTRKKK